MKTLFGKTTLEQHFFCQVSEDIRPAGNIYNNFGKGFRCEGDCWQVLDMGLVSDIEMLRVLVDRFNDLGFGAWKIHKENPSDWDGDEVYRVIVEHADHTSASNIVRLGTAEDIVVE